MFKFGFNFNLTPCFFLEISLNSCLMHTARPAFYRVNGQSSRKICFKCFWHYPLCFLLWLSRPEDYLEGRQFEFKLRLIRFFFFSPFFSVAVESFCLFFFLYNFCLFVCFSFIPTAHLYYIWTSRGFVIHVFLVIRWDQPWLGMATYDKASLGMIR